jgi:hypothetical protein
MLFCKRKIEKELALFGLRRREDWSKLVVGPPPEGVGVQIVQTVTV